MKKLICLILCIFMLIPSAVFGEEGALPDIDREIEILKGLKIFSQAEAGENPVTREEFAFYLSEFVYETTEGEFKFADVDENSAYISAISAVASAGAMNGKSKYIFAPKDMITLPEASKAILHILGYDIVAESEGGYPFGYMSVAKRTGLISGISTDGELNKSSMFKLLFNALEVPYAERDTYGTDSFGLKEDSDNILSVVFGIKHAENTRVTCDGYTYISSSKEVPKGHAEADGISYKDEKGILSGLIGKRVDLYYAKPENTGDDRVVLYAAPARYGKTLEISALDVMNHNGNLLEYDDNNTVKTVSISASSDYIFNGRYVDYPELTNDDFKNSSYCFIDSDDSGGYETVVMERAVNYVVDYKKNEPQTILELIRGDSLKLEDEYENVQIILDNGAKASFSDINTNDVLCVMASKDKKLLTVSISTNSFGGTVERISGKDIFIEGKKYKVSEELRNSRYNPELSAAGVFITDSLDRIAMFIRNDTAGSLQYGYIVEGGTLGNGIKEKLALRILQSNGKTELFNVALNCKVDGTTTGNYSHPAYDNLKKDYRVSPPVSMSKVTPQLIKYMVNADGEINLIDTETYDSSKENENSLYSNVGYLTTKMYIYSDNTFGHKVAFESSVQMFKVPGNYDEKRENRYSKITANDLKHGGEYNVKSYNENDVNLASAIVVYDDAGVLPDVDGQLFLVDDIGEALVEDEVVTYVSGWYQKELKTYYLEDDTAGVYMPLGKTSLKQGDILQITTDSYNFIRSFSVKYNVEQKYNITAEAMPHWNVSSFSMPATVYNKVGGLFVVGFGWGDVSTFASGDLGTTGMGWGTIYVFDEEKGETRLGSVDDFNTVVRDGKDASRIYYRTTYGNMEELVIVKLKNNI